MIARTVPALLQKPTLLFDGEAAYSTFGPFDSREGRAPSLGAERGNGKRGNKLRPGCIRKTGNGRV